jgi:DNA-binding NarL/FixJ family response regulator
LKTVFICEDHPLYRQSLEALVQKVRGFKLVGSCGDGVTAVEAFTESVPDIVLLDLNLPKKDGFQILEFLRQHAPETQVVILTSYNDSILADKARKAGANAYLLKDTSGEDLIAALQNLNSAKFYTNVSSVTSLEFKPDEEFKSMLKLTKTEKKLLTALIKGTSVENLAVQFHISENTVKNHKKNIYRKLGVSTQPELILLCQKHGLLDQ